MGGPSRGGPAESGCGTAVGKDPSGLGILEGSCWAKDTDSSCGGCWSMAVVVMFGLFAAAGRGSVSSGGFVLLRGTLEQVCR